MQRRISDPRGSVPGWLLKSHRTPANHGVCSLREINREVHKEREEKLSLVLPVLTGKNTNSPQMNADEKGFSGLLVKNRRLSVFICGYFFAFFAIQKNYPSKFLAITIL